MTNTPSWPSGAGGSTPPRTDGSPFRPLQPPVGPDAPQEHSYVPAAGYGPLGAPQPSHVSIDQFRPPSDKRSFWIVLGAALAVTALLVAALYFTGRPAPLGSASSPSPTPTPSAPRTPTRSGQGIPFESVPDKASGFWEIRKQTWRSDGVLLELSVTVDKGDVTPTFYVFNNDTAEQYHIDLSDAPQPRFPDGALRSGSTSTGNVFVSMPRVDGTLIMMSSRQPQAISALAIHK